VLGALEDGNDRDAGGHPGGDNSGGCGDVYFCDQCSTVVKYARTGITALQ